jgi:hypothetical protein
MINGFFSKFDYQHYWSIYEQETIELSRFLMKSEVIKHRFVSDNKCVEPILYRYLLHCLLGEGVCQPNFSDFQVSRTFMLGMDIQFIEESIALESLMKFIFHPNYDSSGGLKVGFQSEDDRIRFHDNVFRAIELIHRIDIEAFQMIEKNLICICPVYPLKKLKSGDLISFSLDYCIGMVFFSPCHAILTAESLIHETRHNVLNLLLKKTSLVKDPGVLVRTPLREDSRPLLGLLHQTYVLSGLTKFYYLLKADLNYLSMSNIHKRFNLHLMDYRQGVKGLIQNGGSLSDVGTDFVKDLINDCELYGSIL